MSVSEVDRRELAVRLVAAIGEEAAETLMRCILPEGRDELATKADLQVWRAEVQVEMAALESKMETGFAALESKMETGFARLESKMEAKFAKQARIHFGTLSAFILSVWAVFVAQTFM